MKIIYGFLLTFVVLNPHLQWNLQAKYSYLFLQSDEIITINFSGNKEIKDIELLSSMLLSKTNGSTSRVILKKQFIPELLETDLKRIHNYLIDKGFLHSEVGQPIIETNGNNTTITIPVKEGLKYKLGKISFYGVNYFMPSSLLELTNITPGDLLRNINPLDEFIEKINTKYSNVGFLKARINIEKEEITNNNTNECIINYKIDINEGVLYYIRRIDFQGNLTTGDAVIRRKIFLNEGDPYNSENLNKTIKNINHLGLFKKMSTKDIKYSLDEENHTVDITIKFIEIKRK